MRSEQLAGTESGGSRFSEVTDPRVWALQLALLVLLVTWTPLAGASTLQFQKAVVTHVEKSQPTLPYRRRLADSPPAPTEYDYEISLRMGCLVYVGLYQSAIEYLPSAIADNQPVEVSVEKHVMHVRVPAGEEIKLEIVRRYKESTGCSSGR